MKLLPFDKMPKEFQNDEVKPYYDILFAKRKSLVVKRCFDILVSLIMIILLAIPMLIIAVLVKCTSKGPVLYKQERVTAYGKRFKILKFRTMCTNADKIGPLVTGCDDSRITPIGKTLRRLRLDELPQIFHVLSGKMSLVGARPEVPKYVKAYTPVMMATLIMPAGITSLASIKFKDEDDMLANCDDIEKEYITNILPKKMDYNLKYLGRFGFRRDLYLMLKTVKDVLF